LPDAVHNPVSLVGMAIATAMAVVFLVLLLLELTAFLTNPYIGLLLFVAVPACFVVGLLLIPGGIWLSRRRGRLPAEAEWPVIDLRIARHRTVFAAVIALTAVNLVIVSLAAYGGVHYMESSEFCGQVCHTTMEPQYTAHKAFAHPQVSCSQCHIGPGANAAVEAKLAGVRQLLHVMTGRVPRPVPPPAELISSTELTCRACHAPERSGGDETRVLREYASDESNSETATTLQLKIGGLSAAGWTGIHRHIGLDIEYVAADDRRESILAVRVRDPQRGVREYLAEGATAEQVASGTSRRMSCLDCHNRPAHTFAATPERAIDAGLAAGTIPRELPFVRREALRLVRADYPDRAAALEAIARELSAFYRERGGADNRLVERAVSGTQAAWSVNVFPAMRVTWGTYPNHIGHVDTPGCFRCHDDGHRAGDGASISQDCELCHVFP
jgi:nitrate/TMAO reductase-like tetraheme cytochrome c subunit